MQLSAFFTGSVLNPVNLAVMSASGGRFAHIGPLFTANESEFPGILPKPQAETISFGSDRLYHFYFESIVKKDPITKKNGVRGPYDFAKVQEWRQKSPGTRRLAIVPLPEFSDHVVRTMLAICQNSVPEIGYAELQIVRNWLGLRLGRGVPLRARSKYDWTCVEFFVRMVALAAPAYAVKRLSLGDVLFDEYVPSGRRGPGLYEMLTAKD